MQTYDDVAARLRLCRKKTGLTIKEFCDKHNLAFGKYSQYENGKRRPPSLGRDSSEIDTIENYARIFEVSPAWLLWDIPEIVYTDYKFFIENNSGDPIFTKGGLIYYERKHIEIGVYCVVLYREQFFLGTMTSFSDFIPLNKDIKPFKINEDDYLGSVKRYEKNF